MLEFDRVRVESGDRALLKDVSFKLQPHKITVLLGRNGSGKSTLLQCVNQCRRYTGEIRLDGQSLALLTPRERARQIAILPQILPETELCVRELAALGRMPYTDASGRLSETDRQAVVGAMQMAGVEDLSERSCGTLSGGERQRAFLAMLLAQNPRIAMLDEPAAYMDVDARHELREHTALLARKQKKTLLVVMHDLNEAVRMADNIVVLDAGECLFSGTLRECLNAHVLEESFRVRRFSAAGEAGEELFFA